MGTIAQEIARIQGAKADLKTAIEAKGVTVPSATLIDGYADLVDQIPTGGGGEEHVYTGHVDTVGLTALGWDSDDIAWLQAHVWWDEADDAFWAVTAANLAFGPNGATPLTWENRATVKYNPDVRFFPKFDPSPSSATSWGSLFYDYNYICAIPTHGWDVSKVTNMYNAFGYCYLLRSVGDLSGWDVSGVTQLNYLFNTCNNLITPGDLSRWNVGSNTYFNYMFYLCYNLQSIGDISGWDTAAATSAINMFNGCRCLRNVGDLSGWDTSGFTGMESMFSSCSRLESLDLSGWDVGKVTRMDSMFNNCVSLVSVGDISEWDVAKVTRMDNMFNSCFNLTDIGDLSSWDTSACTNTQSMFNYCYLLGIRGASGLDTAAITQIQTMFRGLAAISTLDLSTWDLSECTNIGASSGASLVAECFGLATLKLGPKFFAGTFTALYANSCRSWSRDSIYESLYTNQTLRNSSSPARTVYLFSRVYDSLSAQDIADIATKNITLVRS